MNEEWRPIEGYEGLYEVSNTGRVRSLDRYVKGKGESYRLHKGRVLSPIKDKNGYLLINLYCNGKQNIIKIHRLVAQEFLSNPDNLPEVNHKDEDKTNNRVDNLEFCDHKYNMNFGTARIRSINTKIKNGYWTGLSEKEYKKKYYQNHKKEYSDRQKEYSQKNMEKIREYHHQYYLKKKEQIQNNVKSLNDQV